LTKTKGKSLFGLTKTKGKSTARLIKTRGPLRVGRAAIALARCLLTSPYRLSKETSPI
jgi:hypothetical protein